MKAFLIGTALAAAVVAYYMLRLSPEVAHAVIDPRYQPIIRPAVVPPGRRRDLYVCPACGQGWATPSAAETCTDQGCR